jgi:hypothetical protein
MLFRRLNKLYANLNGYFWLPCPLCGKEFGGHEWKDYNGLSSSVSVPDMEYGGKGICPDCTKAGKGEKWTTFG